MKKVVYLLGAGFSAPLGLPVMSTFLDRAKDQYYDSEGQFEHFKAVLETINKLHVANSYYATDLFNIEDILSILEMQGQLSGSSQSSAFTEFLADVITHHTPKPLSAGESPQHWSDFLFGRDLWRQYCAFAAILLGRRFLRDPLDAADNARPGGYACVDDPNRSVTYSVVTLNYDLVLEIAANVVVPGDEVATRFTRDRSVPGVGLAKLHGSVDTHDIVPPTWSKSLTVPSIRESWEFAYQLLRQANELRIVGFSLPDADANVRYLLRAAVIETPNLKRIHVLCRDPDGSVEKRYNDFVRFRNWRFQSEDVSNYLRPILDGGPQWPRQVGSNELERVHGTMFGHDA